MIYFVQPNQGGIDLVRGSDKLDASRMYANILGASAHSDAPPVTPIRMNHEYLYDAQEIVQNNWSHVGVLPRNCIITAKVET